jgi:hypothetical protein
VAQARGLRSGCARSQSALRIGYQVQQATAPAASSRAQRIGRRTDLRLRAQVLELDLVDQQQMPHAIRPSEGSSLSQGRRPSRRASRRLEVIAITTGKVPMIMVGSGPPARWIAAARNR